MLNVEKLAIETIKHCTRRACASYMLVYDPRTHKNLKLLVDNKLVLETAWKHSGDAPVNLKRENYHVQFRIAEACYATLPGAANYQHPQRNSDTRATIEYVEEVAKAKGVKLPVRRTDFNRIFEQRIPEYMVLLIANMTGNVDTGPLKRLEGDTVDLKAAREGPLFREMEEGYNHLCKLPWIADSLVGNKHSLERHFTNGAVFKTSNLTLQQVFVKTITLRYPLEHANKYAGAYMKLKARGFDPATSALLALAINKVDEDRADHCVGMGHDWVNGEYAESSFWEEILQGTYKPRWTQRKSAKWESMVQGFKAVTHNSLLNAPKVPSRFLAKVGEGWQVKTFQNLKLMKEFYDEHRNA